LKFAEQGDVVAQVNMGNSYRDGEGVPKDDNEAIKWFRRAAESGSASGQNNLGWMYENGRGVQSDIVEAYKWYLLGATGGSVNGPKNRDSLAKRMTPAQISEGQRRASEWQAQHAKRP
jgi:uncharacterized protein